MAKKEENRQAQDLFINTDMTLKEIALMVGVSDKTVSRWRDLGKWQELKAATGLSANNIIRGIYGKMAKMLEEGEKFSPDGMAKLAATIDKINPNKTSVSQYINVFKEFSNFLLKHDVKLAHNVVDFQKQFIDEKMNAL